MSATFRKPLLAIAVHDRRRVTSLFVAVLLWAFLGWSITSILAGRGEPFTWAIHNLSIAELRIVLWAGTAVLTAGIVGIGAEFVRMGRSLWRDTQAVSFGLRFTSNGAGAYERLVRWYGGLLVTAGMMMIPLGVSLLYILSTCRYMRDF